MTTPGPERAAPSAQPGRRAFDALFEDPADPADPVAAPPESPLSSGPARDPGPDPADAADRADAVDGADAGGASDDAVEADAVVEADEDANVAPLRPGRTVDTGRLFRSAGADGVTATNAIPALTDDRMRAERERRGLDTPDTSMGAPSVDEDHEDLGAAPVDLVDAPEPGSDQDAEPEPTGAPPEPVLAAAGLAGGAVVGSTAGSSVDAGPAVPVIPGGAGSGSAASAAPAAAVAIPRPESTRGLTGTGVWVVVVGVTVLAGFADALLGLGTTLGWITGAALVASTLYAALTVRAPDLWLAVIVPPLAFLAATLTAGQLTLPGGQGLLVREGVMVFTTLSANAPWIVGATVLALVIVLIRRARLKRSGVL